MAAMMRIVTGTFEGIGADDDPQSEVDRRALEKGFGLERARTDRIGGVEPWLPEHWPEDLLVEASRFLGQVRWSDELAPLTDEQLLQARDELRPWLDALGGYSLIFDQLLGRGALGLSVLGEAIRGVGPPEQGLWVLMWAIGQFRGPADLRDGIGAVGMIDPEWLDGLRSWEAFERMKDEIPGLAEALPPRELAAALRDPERMERLQSRLERFREERAKELDAFFEAHPEYRCDEEGQDTMALAPAEIHEERR